MHSLEVFKIVYLKDALFAWMELV